jgi:hypothetical protein
MYQHISSSYFRHWTLLVFGTAPSAEQCHWGREAPCSSRQLLLAPVPYAKSFKEDQDPKKLPGTLQKRGDWTQTDL